MGELMYAVISTLPSISFDGFFYYMDVTEHPINKN